MPAEPLPCRAAVALASVLMLAAAACSDDPAGGGAATGPSSPTASPAASARPPATGAAGPDGAAGCRPPSPMSTNARSGFPEVRGTSRTAELWGLVMDPGGVPLRTGRETKIVWRMTGGGDLVLSVTGPDGEPSPLAWGPEPHGGSSFERPGDEWGAGYRFTEPGCWHLGARRGTSTADVWIEVRA